MHDVQLFDNWHLNTLQIQVPKRIPFDFFHRLFFKDDSSDDNDLQLTAKRPFQRKINF